MFDFEGLDTFIKLGMVCIAIVAIGLAVGLVWGTHWALHHLHFVVR